MAHITYEMSIGIASRITYCNCNFSW